MGLIFILIFPTWMKRNKKVRKKTNLQGWGSNAVGEPLVAIGARLKSWEIVVVATVRIGAPRIEEKGVAYILILRIQQVQRITDFRIQRTRNLFIFYFIFNFILLMLLLFWVNIELVFDIVFHEWVSDVANQANGLLCARGGHFRFGGRITRYTFPMWFNSTFICRIFNINI